MANQKISALPAATTPLVGTEVLPIVQGGTTDQVSVANLTTGRNVPLSGIAYPASGGGSALAPAFSAYKNANQSIAAFTAVKMAFQVEEFDTNSNYDNTTNYRFTPTVAGYYQVQWSLALNDKANEYYTYLYKNGSSVKEGSNALPNFPTPGTTTQIGGTALIFMNGSTDYLEIYAVCSSAGQVNSSSTQSFFQACMVRGS
jgi:hypothetical protein